MLKLISPSTSCLGFWLLLAIGCTGSDFTGSAGSKSSDESSSGGRDGGADSDGAEDGSDDGSVSEDGETGTAAGKGSGSGSDASDSSSGGETEMEELGISEDLAEISAKLKCDYKSLVFAKKKGKTCKPYRFLDGGGSFADRTAACQALGPGWDLVNVETRCEVVYLIDLMVKDPPQEPLRRPLLKNSCEQILASDEFKELITEGAGYCSASGNVRMILQYPSDDCDPTSGCPFNDVGEAAESGYRILCEHAEPDCKLQSKKN